jgi:alginate O-acetyltransferase complex protein AlgI
MNLASIILLCSVALLVGLIRDRNWRKYILLGSSVFAIYALQPSLPIRYLGFWFPTATLAITVLSWILTSPKNKIGWQESWLAVTILGGIIFLIGLGRSLDLFSFIFPSQPPMLYQIIVAMAAILLAVLIFNRLPASFSPYWIIFLVGIFIVIKTPYLANLMSLALRNIGQQSTQLATPLDIRWLGYSYIAFRIIHTVRDRQTGKLPDVGLAEYLNYVIFFPALAAGPIDRLEHFEKTVNAPLTDPWEIYGEGGKRICIGLFKKFVIADLLVLISLNNTNAFQIRSAGWMWISLYAFAFQIYFDFSGYTDIALGMGRLLGMQLPENFSSPYSKPNLTQFWNNWHITLTQWFRAYFFNPLTRSIRSIKNAWPIPMVILVTQLSTMLLIGLWHGVTLNFVLWGVWHGMGLFLHNRWSNFANVRILNWATTTFKKNLVNGMGVLLTFNYVAIGWVFFVLPSPERSFHVFLTLFGAA